MNEPDDVAAAVHRLEQMGARRLQLQFVDLFGTVNCVNVPASRFAEVCERGAWFDGSAIEGFARVLESDMYLVPDPATLIAVTWEAADGGADGVAEGPGGSDVIPRVLPRRSCRLPQLWCRRRCPRVARSGAGSFRAPSAPRRNSA